MLLVCAQLPLSVSQRSSQPRIWVQNTASFKLSHLGFISTAWKTSHSIQLTSINWQQHWGICAPDCSPLSARDDEVVADAHSPWWNPKWFDPVGNLFPMIYICGLEASSRYQRKICTVSTVGRRLGVINSLLKQLHIDLMNVPRSYLNQLAPRTPLITVGTLEDRSERGRGATIKDHKSKVVDAAVSPDYNDYCMRSETHTETGMIERATRIQQKREREGENEINYLLWGIYLLLPMLLCYNVLVLTISRMKWN